MPGAYPATRLAKRTRALAGVEGLSARRYGNGWRVYEVEINRAPELGVPSAQLTDEELLRELASVHRTRHETLRHGSDDSLAEHGRRMAELEAEYLLRFPEREVSVNRLRD